MSGPTLPTEDRRGVIKRPPPATQWFIPKPLQRIPPEPTSDEAYRLAMANRRKPWARRYLRKHMGDFR